LIKGEEERQEPRAKQLQSFSAEIVERRDVDSTRMSARETKRELAAAAAAAAAYRAAGAREHTE